jgi:hypothetical protein
MVASVPPPVRGEMSIIPLWRSTIEYVIETHRSGATARGCSPGSRESPDRCSKNALTYSFTCEVTISLSAPMRFRSAGSMPAIARRRSSACSLIPMSRMSSCVGDGSGSSGMSLSPSVRRGPALQFVPPRARAIASRLGASRAGGNRSGCACDSRAGGAPSRVGPCRRAAARARARQGPRCDSGGHRGARHRRHRDRAQRADPCALGPGVAARCARLEGGRRAKICGPGIANVEAAMVDGYSTGQGLGMGLSRARAGWSTCSSSGAW